MNEESASDHKLNRRMLILALAACAGVLLLRAPSFFEPAWHTDEGTFAGVAQGILRGGSLYAEAWESKPPLFLYLYAGIFKLFGAGILQLRLAATVAALSTQLIVFFIGGYVLGWRKALWASLLLGVLFAVPFWEGNLALSEVFSLPLACGGVLILIMSSRAGPVSVVAASCAGVLCGLSFLIRQPAVLAVGAAVVWLFLERKLTLPAVVAMGVASAAPLAIAMGGFALLGSFHWFWDANVAYFFSYVPAYSRLHAALVPLLLLPLAMALALLGRRWRNQEPMPSWALPVLWFAFAYVGALINGKDYSHYLLQVFPPLALLAVNLEKPRLRLPAWSVNQRPALLMGGAIVVSWLIVVGLVYRDPTGRHWTKGPNYYAHMLRYAIGSESERQFNVYFDKRVNTTLDLERELEVLDADGKTVYIWGEYPWLYALSDLRPLSRYMTSTYMLENDERFPELMGQLNRQPPPFILFFSDVQPRPAGPETHERFMRMNRAIASFVERRYEVVTKVGNGTVYRLRLTGQVAQTGGQ
jgi:4-amino-4-deoxy-L-arabinose transferase-like glycosyltransferase